MTNRTAAGFETLEADWLTLDEARERVLRGVTPTPAEEVALDDALGRALAEEVAATADLPPFDNSAMDGYAVRSADLEGWSEDQPTVLRVTREIRPGDRPGDPLEPGEAARIMTGGPVPPESDGVIRVEHTDAEETREGEVRILETGDAGRNVRPGGQDVSRGEVLLHPGDTVGSAQIGLLAAAGRSRVRVHRPAVAAILSNGDELVDAAELPEAVAGGAIPDTNGPALAAAVREAGAHPLSLGIARDTEESVKEHVQRAWPTDVLVTVGGASMGAGDLFKRVLDTLGFQLDFWRIRIRPGSPVSFGWLPRGEDQPPLPVFGLPGNPTSAYVTFQLLVRPWLLRAGGHRRCFHRRITARLDEPLTGREDLRYFLRVALDREGDEWRARLSGPQSSGLVSPLARARGLAVLPEGVGEIPAGGTVQVLLLESGAQSEP